MPPAPFFIDCSSGASLALIQGPFRNADFPRPLRTAGVKGCGTWTKRVHNTFLWLTESLCTDFQERARGRKDHRAEHEAAPTKQDQPAHEGDEDAHCGDPQTVFNQN